MAKQQPLGVRLNNPGNLEWGSPWEGLVPREQSRYFATGSSQQKRFCEFKDAASGIRAIARTLITYADKRKADDGSAIDTVFEVLDRWAPAHENDTVAYSRAVAKKVGVDPHTEIDIKDYTTLRALVVGIIAHENAGYAYPAAVVDEGLRRAGVVPAAKSKIPATVETVVGAGGTAVVGLASAAEILPEVAKAIGDQKEELISGNSVRIGLAVTLLVISLVVIWGQWRKRKAGAL